MHQVTCTFKVLFLLGPLVCIQLGRAEVGVSPEKPNSPEAFLYNGGAPTKQNLFRIINFSDTTPPATLFKVPDTCPGSQELENLHPLNLLSMLTTPYLGGKAMQL